MIFISMFCLVQGNNKIGHLETNRWKILMMQRMLVLTNLIRVYFCS